MKKLTLTSIFALLTLSLLAQAPQGISHQAVIRDASNQLVTESPIGIQVSFIQGTPDGTVVYSETHTPTSNANGLISFIIGQGTVVSGIFSEIDWANGSYFIETKADPTAGSNYTITGTSQMLSVPYALHARTAESVAGSVAANIYPPTVIATAASNIESFSATMNGIVNAEGFSSTVVFEWGTTTAYGNTINAIQSPVTGSMDVMVSANLSNLQSATTYHYRIRATNAVNVSYSDDIEFITQASALQLTTDTVTNVLAFSARSGGNISYDGGSNVVARGVVWSTNPIPTLDDNFTEDGEGIGSFTSEITSLIQATTYYVRAYATNAMGTTYGNVRSFATQNGIVTLTSNAITDVTVNSAISGGNITSDGGDSVTARGVVWSLNPEPTLADYHSEDGSGIGSYTSAITGLTGNIHYYVRAYAINATGTYFSNELTFFTFNCASLLLDADNNTYNTVLIGNQCWMKESLRTSKDANGNSITRYCYNNNNNNCGWYGGLYTWSTMMNGAVSSNSNPSGVQGICPYGWHIPSDDEWQQLLDYLHDEHEISNTNTLNGAGNALKSCRQVGSPLGGACNTSEQPRWNSHSSFYGTDLFNFSALPGGWRTPTGGFNEYLVHGYWRTATEYSEAYAYTRSIWYNRGFVGGYNGHSKDNGFSVRCLRD